MINLEKQNSKNAEPLELNDNTVRRIFGYNPFISHYKEGMVFFNRYEIENADKLAIIFMGFIIFLAMINFESYLLRIVILLAYILLALNVFNTKKYVVLDYYKKEFYYETHNLFFQKKSKVFPFDKIQNIKIVFEEKTIIQKFGSKRNSTATISIANIVFYSSNNKSFLFLSSPDNNFTTLNTIARNLALALKKDYSQNAKRVSVSPFS